MIKKFKDLAEAAQFILSRNAILSNQSLVGRTDYNQIVHKGVNVIVDKPERGDVLCITRYMENGELAPEDKQEIVWVKGDTVRYNDWPQGIFEPVGVCYRVRGNKAYCRYKTETSCRWADTERWALSGSHMNDGASHTATVSYSIGSTATTIGSFTWTASSKYEFYTKFKAFLESGSVSNEVRKIVSVDWAQEGHDFPSSDRANAGRVVVNCRFQGSDWITISFDGTNITANRQIGIGVPANNIITRVNGDDNSLAGCCRQKWLEYTSSNGYNPENQMSSIYEYSSSWPYCTVSKAAWDVPYAQSKCQILHDTYKTYEECVEATMAKYPAGGKGQIGLYFDKGYDFTKELATSVYTKYVDGTVASAVQASPYAAAYTAYATNCHCKGLTFGNWWLPCAAEMYDLMVDVTYGCTGFELPTAENIQKAANGEVTLCDPVNRAIFHLNNESISSSNGFQFMDLGAETSYKYSCSAYLSYTLKEAVYVFVQNFSCFDYNYFWNIFYVSSITVVNLD